jgi:hypothetical protein
LSVFGGGKFGFAGAAILPGEDFAADFALAADILALSNTIKRKSRKVYYRWVLPDAFVGAAELCALAASGELISTARASSNSYWPWTNSRLEVYNSKGLMHWW